MAAAYSTIGPYKGGVWLVAAPDGTGAVLPRNNLPPQGTGYKYYWLGSTQPQAETRILDAIDKLNIQTTLGVQDLRTPVRQAFAGQPGQLDKPLTGLQAVLHQIGEAAVIPPLGKVGAAIAGAGAGAGAGEGAAAGAGAAGAGAAGAGAAAAGASGLELAAVLAGVWSFLTAPSSWLRILKYIAGAVLIFFALKELTGVQTPAVVKRAMP